MVDRLTRSSLLFDAANKMSQTISSIQWSVPVPTATILWFIVYQNNMLHIMLEIVGNYFQDIASFTGLSVFLKKKNSCVFML